MTIEEKEKKEVARKITRTQRLYNPTGVDYMQSIQIKSIEMSDEYTRIDFLYRSSNIYINGGWINMSGDSYIQPCGSKQQYRLIRAIGIPIAPSKHYFKKQGEYKTYTLIFPALPESTRKINIIEKEGPGNFFNFYNMDYSKWMSVPCASAYSPIGN